MANWNDLKNVVDLQKGLLTSIGTSASADDSNAVANINVSLSNLSGNLSAANSAIGPTLTYQQEVKAILDRENNRLVTRKVAIDSAYDGQKRMVNLTDSITAKNKAYNYILFILVLTLVLFVLIKMLYSIEGIPQTSLDILSVVVISLGLVYCVYLYIDIKRRYNMDFNQITLAEPVKKTPAEIQKDQEKNAKAGDLYKLAKSANAASGCQGSACCPAGTTFNEINNICVPNMVPFGPGITDATKGNYKYFIKDNAWHDVTLTTTATPLAGCDTRTSAEITANAPVNGLANYDSAKLACKVIVSPFTTISGNFDLAKPFSATEFTGYSAY